MIQSFVLDNSVATIAAMAESLKEKVIVITGASSGIGAASAVELAKFGTRLVLHGRNEKALDEVKGKCVDNGLKSSEVAIVTGDICEDQTITKIVETAKDTFGTLHVVFNNAGYGHPKDGPIHMGGSVEAMDAMYNIYVRAPYLLVQQCLPELIKNKGVVINCSSGNSRLVSPALTGYCTAKAGQDHLTRLMAIALGMKGVRVNSINPGYVATNIVDRAYGKEMGAVLMDMNTRSSPFEQRLATPEEIAKIVRFLASDDSAAIHGENVFCDLAFTHTNPIIDFTQFK